MTVQGDIESHTSSTWLASMVLVGALSTLAPLAYRAVASNHCLCNPMADVLHRRSGESRRGVSALHVHRHRSSCHTQKPVAPPAGGNAGHYPWPVVPRSTG